MWLPLPLDTITTDCEYWIIECWCHYLCAIQQRCESQGNIRCPKPESHVYSSVSTTGREKIGMSWLPWCEVAACIQQEWQQRRFPQSEKNVQSIVAKEWKINMKPEAPGLLKESILNLYASSFLFWKGSRRAWRFQRDSNWVAVGQSICLSLLFLYCYPESWPEGGEEIQGYGQGLCSSPKELIYGQTFTISVQLISQGTQKLSNKALDIQVGLQKKSFV